MKIGIFSKCLLNGGSSHQCAEIANGLTSFGYKCTLLTEKHINKDVPKRLVDGVDVIQYVQNNKEILYNYDTVIIVVSDGVRFTREKYWEDIDLEKIPQIIYLFNFVAKPAKNLQSLISRHNGIKIICSNSTHFQTVMNMELKCPIIFMPNSIDPNSISSVKINSNKIRIGKHALGLAKHNSEWPQLIRIVNNKYGNNIIWDLMGVPNQEAKKLIKINNVIIRPGYSISVKEYLKGIDIFCYFTSFNATEAWGRVITEAMMSGCPILTCNKLGPKDQVENNVNGYICDSMQEFADRLCFLIEHKNIREQITRNNIHKALEFTTENITKRLIDFIEL